MNSVQVDAGNLNLATSSTINDDVVSLTSPTLDSNIDPNLAPPIRPDVSNPPTVLSTITSDQPISPATQDRINRTVKPLPRGVPDTTNRYTLSQKVQALTLHQVGYNAKQILAMTGVKKRSFWRILDRAKKQGYDPKRDTRLLDHFFEERRKTGRPRKERDENGQIIRKGVGRGGKHVEFEDVEVGLEEGESLMDVVAGEDGEEEGLYQHIGAETDGEDEGEGVDVDVDVVDVDVGAEGLVNGGYVEAAQFEMTSMDAAVMGS